MLTRILYKDRQAAPFGASLSYAPLRHQIDLEVPQQVLLAFTHNDEWDRRVLLQAVKGAGGDTKVGSSFSAREDFRPVVDRTGAALSIRYHLHLDFGCLFGRVVCCRHRRSHGTPLTCDLPMLRRPRSGPITGQDPLAPGAPRRRSFRSLTCRDIAPPA